MGTPRREEKRRALNREDVPHGAGLDVIEYPVGMPGAHAGQ